MKNLLTIAALALCVSISACDNPQLAAYEQGDLVPADDFLPKTQAVVNGTVTLTDTVDAADDQFDVQFPALTDDSRLMIVLFRDGVPGIPAMAKSMTLPEFDRDDLDDGIPQTFEFELSQFDGLHNGEYAVAVVLDVEGDGPPDFTDPGNTPDCYTVLRAIGPPPFPVALTVDDSEIQPNGEYTVIQDGFIPNPADTSLDISFTEAPIYCPANAQPLTTGTAEITVSLQDPNTSGVGPNFPAFDGDETISVSLYANRSFPPSGPPDIFAIFPLAAPPPYDRTGLDAGTPQVFPIVTLTSDDGLFAGEFALIAALDIDGDGFPETGTDCQAIKNVAGPPSDPMPVGITVADDDTAEVSITISSFGCP